MADGYYDEDYMAEEDEWDREQLLDPAWEKQQKKVRSLSDIDLYAMLAYNSGLTKSRKLSSRNSFSSFSFSVALFAMLQNRFYYRRYGSRHFEVGGFKFAVKNFTVLKALRQ